MNLKEIEKHGVPVFGDTSWRGECPLETADQIAFLTMLRKDHSDLAEIAVHVRNEGQRSKRQGAQHKREGMNTGASDILIPSNPPLVIELKRRDHTKSSISNQQIAYLVRSHRLGAFSCVALGASGAMEAVNQWQLQNKK